jgi:hypothetical protein
VFYTFEPGEQDLSKDFLLNKVRKNTPLFFGHTIRGFHTGIPPIPFYGVSKPIQIKFSEI